MKKGIERMEKQIFQLISVHISQEQVDIALLKMCKTVDVPAVNAAIGNIQRALLKYVSFDGMESKFCEKVENLLEKAQLWCLNIDELYIKTEMHSINTSKGNPADVSQSRDHYDLTMVNLVNL